MAANGWRGVTRARKVRTTVPDPAHCRAPDLVNRDFTAAAPGELVVADFTYVPRHGGGFGYTAFCIDAFAGLIAGWECSLSKETAFVQKAIGQAAALRSRQGHPAGGRAIHHSDAGSQYTSVRFAETLMLAGWQPPSGPSGTPTITRWRKRPSACTRPSAPATGHRSVQAPSPPWPTSGRSPARGCTGTTTTGSCTGSGAGHQPKPRPGTTSKPAPARAVRLDMGPSRRAASSPRASRIKIQAAASPGYSPPPHVKPHSATLTTSTPAHELLTQKPKCARNSGCSRLPARSSTSRSLSPKISGGTTVSPRFDKSQRPVRLISSKSGPVSEKLAARSNCQPPTAHVSGPRTNRSTPKLDRSAQLPGQNSQRTGHACDPAPSAHALARAFRPDAGIAGSETTSTADISRQRSRE